MDQASNSGGRYRYLWNYDTALSSRKDQSELVTKRLNRLTVDSYV